MSYTPIADNTDPPFAQVPGNGQIIEHNVTAANVQCNSKGQIQCTRAHRKLCNERTGGDMGCAVLTRSWLLRLRRAFSLTADSKTCSINDVTGITATWMVKTDKGVDVLACKMTHTIPQRYTSTLYLNTITSTPHH